MRERVTFIHGAESAFDPDQIQVNKDSIHIKSLQAAREDRITFGFQDLPQEVIPLHQRKALQYLI